MEGYRKVVVSTNVAETSLTIPGIVYVIDSMFVKVRNALMILIVFVHVDVLATCVTCGCEVSIGAANFLKELNFKSFIFLTLFVIV